jgi:hypothetical protein
LTFKFNELDRLDELWEVDLSVKKVYFSKKAVAKGVLGTG